MKQILPHIILSTNCLYVSAKPLNDSSYSAAMKPIKKK